MSEGERKIIITGGDADETPQAKSQLEEREKDFEPSEADEERFFLMYNMNFQPSEVENLKNDYRRWLIGRFIHQKKMEQAMMQEAQIRNRIASDTLGPKPGGPSGLHLVR